MAAKSFVSLKVLTFKLINLSIFVIAAPDDSLSERRSLGPGRE